ncbi:leucine-rich repeat-containing protein 47-like [Linepithema humile]|uniref:leucine-rich repeat-containing protein 47-like n=1 Tax=Linepithema humile TaxID=83485 RepID=UPI0006230E14|nr:PREDICTED: leucine-rich repeat-containing protein 47-like [Linepithema humile]XP_012224682.1 PREDICTED: leucine-rich repeat-containing protein 47-like [Linepithema humile]
MLENSWVTVKQAADENRHELVLTGASVSRLIEKSGLDENLFNLYNLNYLSITQTCLREIPDEIEKLTNLTVLVLHSNEINLLSNAIGKLSKLKILDCSRNKLTSVPQSLDTLPQLNAMNFSSNLLQSIPSQNANTKLSVLNLSNNCFETFPDVCYAELVHLSEIFVNGNQITTIPSSISQLQALKILNVADNLISVVPGELADCSKLKEVNLKGNKLADKRLLKLVNQCRTKQILDYIKLHCPKSELSTTEANKSRKGKKNQKCSESENTVDTLAHKLKVLRMVDGTPVIKVTKEVQKIRPYIAACIVKNLSFTEDSFKKFIQLQTKLHDGVCEKRNAATIATHDLKLIVPGDLTYTAKPPTEVEIKPLMREKTYTGAVLFQQLQTEAENLRKEKKRNVYSGIHKYLYLLEGKSVFPCLLDYCEQVISLPPITNSDITKMSPSTETMFVEVTSAISYTVCRNVLDEFLKELIMSGLTDSSQLKDGDKLCNNLLVEQVKIVDFEGNLKLIYPSRADLNSLVEHSISILRD